MPDLAVIQLTPGVMTENLAMSLAHDGSKPWAFNKLISTMNAMQAGVHVLFVEVKLPSGAAVGKNGTYPLEAMLHRTVLGTITSQVDETSAPFFAGYPHEFWFDLKADEALDPALSLEEASTRLNQTLPGLEMDAAKLRQVLSNGRSAKVGLYFDGEPRTADYFKHLKAPAKKVTAGNPTTATPVPSAAPATHDAIRTAVDHFIEAVRNSGLVFTGVNEDLPRAFLCGLMTKPFAILTGLSGSGKTQLARAFGQWLGSDEHGPRHLVVPVRADWTTPDPLLGYEDALLPPDTTGARGWSVPPALEFVLRATHDPSHLYALVLDEMNLAHVERYFADFLSGMESGEPVLPNLQRSRGQWYPVPGAPALRALPSNLFVIGTVNVDETTYQFSPKVLDRSFSYEFRVSTEELNGSMRKPAAVAPASPTDIAAFIGVSADHDWHLKHASSCRDEVEQWLTELHRMLSPVGLEFGHRTFREATRLSAVMSAAGITNFEALADWVAMTKVLPRVHGSRRQLEPLLTALKVRAIGDDAEKPTHPLLARKVSRMLDTVVANQYTGFAE